MTHTIINLDCLVYLRSLQDNTFESVVTDPPYGLSFMGKKWDYDVPSVEIWRECLRVLKPGGHLLSFAGARTYHRMAVNIEDAGFEIRDQIMWVYGSGFPKSLDVSKAIDKGSGENRSRQLEFTAWMSSTGITAKQINDATGSCMGSHYLTDREQPAIATADMFDKLRTLLPEVPEKIERLVAERTGIEWTAYKQRKIIGQKIGKDVQKGDLYAPGEGTYLQKKYNITNPATESAKQWHGWGTALKPAHEPIVVARKPLIGTVAENVMTHGTGAVNIDGCRAENCAKSFTDNRTEKKNDVYGKFNPADYDASKGRWPANLIHDGSEEVTGLFDTASRFFYCAKASKRDRDEGLESLHVAERSGVGALRDGGRESKPRKNIHPTVKPTDLMRYLCRLITPPKGTILDPFMGSGSTGKAAKMEGFSFVGVEREKEYCEIAKKRIESAARYID